MGDSKCASRCALVTVATVGGETVAVYSSRRCGFFVVNERLIVVCCCCWVMLPLGCWLPVELHVCTGEPAWLQVGVGCP